MFWFQLYRFANNDHHVGFDLVRRADAAGAHVLMLTLDVPVRTTRSREVAVGITNPFRVNLRMMLGDRNVARLHGVVPEKRHAALHQPRSPMWARAPA